MCLDGITLNQRPDLFTVSRDGKTWTMYERPSPGQTLDQLEVKYGPTLRQLEAKNPGVKFVFNREGVQDVRSGS